MKKLKYLVLIPTLLPVALAQAADSGPNPDAVGADETSILYWSAKASAPDCSADFVESLRTPLDAFERHPDGTFVNREFKSVRCNLTLRPDDEIFYRLIVKGSAASGVTIDCNGALINGWVGPNYNTEDRRSTEMIEINSIARQPEPSWDGEYDVPQYVTVKNCRIRGSIRIRGMGSNGEAAEVVRSSRRPGHLDRLRDNAPSHVVIENVDFTPKKRTPLYLTPGVHHVTVRDSTFSGNLNRSTMYMDVSSSHNLVVRNTFRARNQDTDYLVYRRTFPEIAVDGSHHNHIKNNLFTEHVKEEGGIWLYRNCGEGGGIRWTGPEYNVIEGNDFYDLSSDFLNDDEPAIHIGSRDNGLTGFKPYCNDDEGVSGVNYAALSGMNPPHSAEDNGNYARYNRVLHNTFYGISSGDRVKIRDNGKNTENIRVNNQGIQSYRNTLFAYPREGDTFGEAR
ncbi:MAG: right-handed parallel beta-helix repeat-containing protein, partial [Myxococcota bacterium]